MAEDVMAVDDRGVYASDEREQGVVQRLAELIDAENICELLDDGEVSKIGQQALRDFDTDDASRKEWKARYDRAMKIAMQVKEARNFPWANAANVKYPVLTVAAIQFQARAYPAIVDGSNLVKGKVLGPDPEGKKRERADRIGAHMSWQLLYDMPSWEEETDRLLLMLPIVGCVFRKVYRNQVERRNAADIVPADDFVVNANTKSLLNCPVQSHVIRLYPHEIEERVRRGIWAATYTRKPDDESTLVEFIEQHRLIDLDGDGYPEPYIVTVCRDGGCGGNIVARIVANYRAEDVEIGDNDTTVLRITPDQHFVKYGFIPAPDGSFYDIGFGFLLDSLGDTIDTLLNQAIDAGTLANAQGGFIGNAVNLRGGSMQFTLGEWKRVDTGGMNLRENIVPLNLQGPSPVALSILEMLLGAAKEITSVQDILTGDAASSTTPVGTVYAMIEQGMKVMTSIFKRIHRSFGQELRILRNLNRDYLEDQQYFEMNDGQPGVVMRADYEDRDLDVMPVSDPTQATDLQKMGRAQYLGTFRGDPNVNQRELTRRQLEAANTPDIKTLMEIDQRPDPAILMKGAEMANAREKTQSEIRRNDAETAAKLATTARELAEYGLLIKDANTQAFAAELAEIARSTMERVAAATEEGDDDEAAGADAGGMGGMEGVADDDGVPALPGGPAGEPGGSMAEGPALAGPADFAGGGDDLGEGPGPVVG